MATCSTNSKKQGFSPSQDNVKQTNIFLKKEKKKAHWSYIYWWYPADSKCDTLWQCQTNLLTRLNNEYHTEQQGLIPETLFSLLTSTELLVTKTGPKALLLNKFLLCTALVFIFLYQQFQSTCLHTILTFVPVNYSAFRAAARPQASCFAERSLLGSETVQGLRDLTGNS